MAFNILQSNCGFVLARDAGYNFISARHPDGFLIQGFALQPDQYTPQQCMDLGSAQVAVREAAYLAILRNILCYHCPYIRPETRECHPLLIADQETQRIGVFPNPYITVSAAPKFPPNGNLPVAY